MPHAQETIEPVIEPAQEPVPIQERWNEKFIKVLEELTDIMQRQGEPFKARAYQKAQESIMTYEGDIQSLDQIINLPGIGKTITSKLDELMKTGTLRILERERTNPVNLLTKIYGVGPKKAEELVKSGITTIAELRSQPKLLNDVQRTGLKYFEAIEARIPRSEIDSYNQLLTAIFQKSTPTGSHLEIVGSYRRGAKDSGDIDIIVTNQDNNNNVLKLFMDQLLKEKILIEILSRGKTKSLTIAQLPIEGATPRRLDFLYSPPSEYAFALLYFTGSKAFNTVQRQRALKLGYTLNEHGLSDMTSGVKGGKVAGDFPTEQAIFDKLGMVYKEPSARIDGRAVQFVAQVQEPVPEPAAAPAPLVQVPVQVPIPSKTKRTTLKNKPTTAKAAQGLIETFLTAFKLKGATALQTMTEEDLSKFIRAANNAYYCNQKPLMTDNEYDVLREYTLERYPANVAAQEGHINTQCAEKEKATLPYEMWSMDKIKPDTNALERWKQTYKGPYVLSCKLDGVSGLYSTEGPVPKLYTRGNGTVGQDVSHLLPCFKLPQTPGITLRGEFIIKKTVFKEKYAKDFANPRNLVAGIINQKNPDLVKCVDVDFVAYEVLKPDLKPSAQLTYLTTLVEKTEQKTAYGVVEHLLSATVTNDILSELLLKWRADNVYEIDGVICVNDAIYPRQTGNPAHAFAFKMVLSDQIAEAKVLNVIWTASKDGYLKPRVHLEPVSLSGVTIEYATGFNAKFIEENRIGVGALIRLMRSGDVVPHIISVVQPAEQPQMPTEAYEWNATHVDIMLQDKADNVNVKEKTIANFFSSLEVDGLGPGNVKKIIAAGYDNVPKILAMAEADFLKVAGFKLKMATKIRENIAEKIVKASLAELMHASNLFGRGFGTKKIQLILTQEPTIMTDTTVTPAAKIQRVAAIEGMAKKTAEQFVTQIPVFLAFLTEANLVAKVQQTVATAAATAAAASIKDTSHPLYGKQYIMTGFRDKPLMETLAAVGAEQGTSVGKKTFVLLVKDIGDENSKTETAQKLNIPIMTADELRAKYKL